MSDTLAQPTITVTGGSLPENTQGTPITTSAYTCDSLTLGINEYDLQFTNTDTWQWESSPAGTPSWTPITGATSTTYVATEADYGVGTTLFRVRVTRNGNTQYSTNVVSANFVASLSVPTLTFDTPNSTLFKKHVTATVSGADPNLPLLYNWYAHYVVAGATQDTILVKSSLDNYYDLTWRDFLRYGGKFTGNITGVADGGNGTFVLTSDIPIELIVNDIVIIENTANYNGRYRIKSLIGSPPTQMTVTAAGDDGNSLPAFVGTETGIWSGENHKQINLTCAVSYAGMDTSCASLTSSSIIFIKWVEGYGDVPTFDNQYVLDPKDIRITSATITSCTSNNQAGLSFSNVTTNLNLSTGAAVGPFNWYDASYIGTSSNTSGASSALSDAVVLLDYTATEPQTIMSATVMLDSPVTSLPTQLLITSPEGAQVWGTSNTVTVSNAGVPTAYTYTFSPSVWLPAGAQFWLILQAVPPTSRAGNVFAVLNMTNLSWLDTTVWRSDGEGKTWVKCLLHNNFGASVPSMPEFLLAAGGYLFMEFGAGKALGRSADGGDNWTSCSPPGTTDWYSMAAQPGGSRICVGVDTGTVCFSSDYGNTWSSVQVPNWGYHPCGPLYWPYNNRLYLLSDNSSGPNGILTSTDGATWTLLRYRSTVTFGGSTYQLLSLFFPPDPTKPPWAVGTGAGSPVLVRGQMVNGSWNGCFDGEVWVDPSSGQNPSGTATNYLPSGLANSNEPWLIFHDDRMIVFGCSSLTPQTIPTSWVSTSDDTIIADVSYNGWGTGTKVRYRTAGGAALAPLVDGQDCYVIVADSSHIKLATTLANAQAGIAIDLTSTGNSSQTLGVAQAGIATTPIAYATAGTPVWTYPEVDRGLDFEMAWMDPNNHSYIWASEVSADGSSRNIGGIWRSLDGGQTWSPSNVGIEQYNLDTNYPGRPMLVSANTPVPGPLIPIAYGGSGQYKYHFMSGGNPYVTVSITGNGTTATATTAAPHLLPNGDTNVIISDTGNSNLDGLRVATKIDNVTFTFPSVYNGSSISGKMSYWLTYNT